MKKKQRSQFCALEKLHFKGMFQQTLERREETRHGGKIFQRRKFLKCLRKRAVSGSEPATRGQSDHRRGADSWGALFSSPPSEGDTI